jgi:deoxyribonuclease V
MIACLDVHYSRHGARAAAVVSDDWESESSVSEYATIVPAPAKYEPGRFYLRELQPLLSVIRKIVQPIDAYVIDGYCYLSSDHEPGLGAHLMESLDSEAWIVGVAKSRYRNTNHSAPLLRGRSTRPLFITAIGVDYQRAAERVASMAGEFRIPTLLKAADRLSRAQPGQYDASPHGDDERVCR